MQDKVDIFSILLPLTPVHTLLGIIILPLPPYPLRPQVPPYSKMTRLTITMVCVAPLQENSMKLACLQLCTPCSKQCFNVCTEHCTLHILLQDYSSFALPLTYPYDVSIKSIYLLQYICSLDHQHCKPQASQVQTASP